MKNVSYATLLVTVVLLGSARVIDPTGWNPVTGWAVGAVAAAALWVWWTHRVQFFAWWSRWTTRRYVGDLGISSDLGQDYSCFEMACACAGVKPLKSAWSDPKVAHWVDLLTDSSTVMGRRIDRATILTLTEWLPIVQGICKQRNEPMPGLLRIVWAQGRADREDAKIS